MSTPTFAKTHNLFAYLEKPTEREEFAQIIDFLNGSSVKYALTTSPIIYTSCIKQFWTSAKVKTVNDEVRIQALVDGKRVNIKESSIRRTLRLDDAEGTSCLTNIEIFKGLAKIGYEKPSDKLTFYKAFFSPQWKFLIHTIFQCLSAKTTSSNEFSSTMASAIICLTTNQKFNFSRYILLSLVKKIEAGVPFFMFSRVRVRVRGMGKQWVLAGNGFGLCYKQGNRVRERYKRGNRVRGVSGILQADAQSIPITTKPSTSKPKRSILKNLREDSLKLKDLMDLCTNLSNKVIELESEVIDIKSTYQERIEKLEGRVERLEEENKVLKELKSVHYIDDADEPVMAKEKSSKQWRKITDIDADVEINLEKAQAEAYNLDLDHQEKVLSMMDVNEEEPADVKEVMEVVKATKLVTEVVTTAGATKVSVPRKRRGVIIQDPEETTTTATVQLKVQSKDKGKAILVEEPKPLKRQAHIKLDEEVARQLEAELNADIN
uniref:Xylulose kinase-1 n=1 Tax=Tanacetum cinerariifolium TaxID=118510 RepID=A0A6L2KWV3_TANCI|nr:hypothetical protein [Tanacetum cinerariifolium]